MMCGGMRLLRTTDGRPYDFCVYVRRLFGGNRLLRTTDGRPYGSNVVRQLVVSLTSVRIQGMDAYGVGEIDLKRVPNR